MLLHVLLLLNMYLHCSPCLSQNSCQRKFQGEFRKAAEIPSRHDQIRKYGAETTRNGI